MESALFLLVVLVVSVATAPLGYVRVAARNDTYRR
jgi:hypothetical protein